MEYKGEGMVYVAQKKAGIILGYTNFALRMLIQLIYIPFMLKILGPNKGDKED